MNFFFSCNFYILIHLLIINITYIYRYSKLEGAFSNWRKLGDGFEYANPIQYNQEYRQVEMQKKADRESDSESENLQWEEESESGGRKIMRVMHDNGKL